MDLYGSIAQVGPKVFGLGLSGPNYGLGLSMPNWVGPLMGRVILGYRWAYGLVLSLVTNSNKFGLPK